VGQILQGKEEEWRDADTDKSGTVEFDEFAKMMENQTSGGDEEMLSAFKAFDKNGDGFITKEELKLAMKNMGENLSAKELEEMMKSADTSGDGRIDYKEFAEMMKQ